MTKEVNKITLVAEAMLETLAAHTGPKGKGIFREIEKDFTALAYAKGAELKDLQAFMREFVQHSFDTPKETK